MKMRKEHGEWKTGGIAMAVRIIVCADREVDNTWSACIRAPGLYDDTAIRRERGRVICSENGVDVSWSEVIAQRAGK